MKGSTPGRRARTAQSLFGVDRLDYEFGSSGAANVRGDVESTASRQLKQAATMEIVAHCNGTACCASLRRDVVAEANSHSKSTVGHANRHQQSPRCAGRTSIKTRAKAAEAVRNPALRPPSDRSTSPF